MGDWTTGGTKVRRDTAADCRQKTSADERVATYREKTGTRTTSWTFPSTNEPPRQRTASVPSLRTTMSKSLFPSTGTRTSPGKSRKERCLSGQRGVGGGRPSAPASGCPAAGPAQSRGRQAERQARQRASTEAFESSPVGLQWMQASMESRDPRLVSVGSLFAQVRPTMGANENSVGLTSLYVSLDDELPADVLERDDGRLPPWWDGPSEAGV